MNLAIDGAQKSSLRSRGEQIKFTRQPPLHIILTYNLYRNKIRQKALKLSNL